jgi:hypothetical protein
LGDPKGLAHAWPQAERSCRARSIRRGGLLGTIVGKRPIGSYHYEKQLSRHHGILCEVTVFLFLVERQLDDWPEKAERETRWFEPSAAYTSVDEGGLAEILRRVLHVGVRQ